jgi:phosphatidylethanolamine/phosphatidyl-N-methylethanolamine N-methyltransferase
MRRRVVKAKALLRRSMVKALAPDGPGTPPLAAAVEDLLLPRHSPWDHGRKRRRRSGHALFTRELLSNPRAIGAACPSSRWLAKSLARRVPRGLGGRVIELGGGTGVVTAALLRRGFSAGQLVVVERSRTLAAHLRRRFPQVHVIQGDAADLSNILPADDVDVCAVVSSLPLRSLPAVTVQRIMSQLEQVLPSGSIFVQYTYALRAGTLQLPPRFQRMASRIVWRNFPPARVDVYRA